MAVYEYGSCIKLTFDKALINDIESIIGTEEYEISKVAGAASGSPADVQKAFDGIGSNTQSADSGIIVIKDMARAISVTQVKIYLGTPAANTCTIYGSANGVDWISIKTYNFINLQPDVIDFDSAQTYQHWKFEFPNNIGGLTEIAFFGVRNIYDTTGWQVFGQEYIMEPGLDPEVAPESVLQEIEYIVRKVTKSEDNLSIYLWLDLAHRMKHPQGTVRIQFTGALFSEDTSFVEPFDAYLTPETIDPVFDHHALLYVDTNLTMLLTPIQIYYIDTQLPDEYVSAQLSATVVMIHVNDINQ